MWTVILDEDYKNKKKKAGIDPYLERETEEK